MNLEDEDFDYLLEGENAPTNPSLWSRAKSLARSKFDKYPSAYANGWAAKWYKSKGGGWKKKKKKTNESTEVLEALKELIMEDLSQWFNKEKWKRITTSGEIAGDCGTSKNKKNPDRCLPAAKAHSLTKSERAATAKKKKQKSKGGHNQFVSNTKKAKVKST